MIKTICDYPLAIREILRRNEARAARRGRRPLLPPSFFLVPSSTTHTARISPTETVESNLPLPNERSKRAAWLP
jgi:hypothetical protein